MEDPKRFIKLLDVLWKPDAEVLRNFVVEFDHLALERSAKVNGKLGDALTGKTIEREHGWTRHSERDPRKRN
jgi:hypothetical protein